MTQQPGKGSEYRQNQAQDPTSFKDSLHDVSKHLQRAPLAEAEETEGLDYENVKEVEERIAPDQKTGTVGAHRSHSSDERSDVGDTDLSGRSASLTEGLGYESVKAAKESIALDQEADNSGAHKRRSSFENTFLGEDGVDLSAGSTNLTESNPNEPVTSKESNQKPSETEQREQSVRKYAFDAADGPNAFRTQPSISKDGTKGQCRSGGKDIAGEDKADYVNNQPANGALQIQHDCKTTDGQLNKSVGEMDNELDKSTSTRDNATGTVTDESKNIAAEQLNSANSIDKELHDAREPEFDSLKLGNDIEVPTEKNKSSGGETLDACSSGTENETHKVPCCQENQNNEAVLKEIKSAEYQLALGKTETVGGSKRKDIKLAEAEHFRKKLKGTKLRTGTEQYTITEANFNKSTENVTETKTGDMKKEIDEDTTKLSSVTICSTRVPENASDDINTEVPKPDENPGNRGDYHLPGSKDVKCEKGTSDAIFDGKKMADVTSGELVKNDSEEANMNCEVILSENLPLIRCLKLIRIVMERFPKVNVCDDSDQIKFTSVSVEEAAAAKNHLDVLVSSLNSKTLPLRHPIAMLLHHIAVKTSLQQRMDKEGIQCYWLVTSDGFLKLYGLNTEMLEKAWKIIKENICIKKEVESAFASELILKFSGKCQKWVAAESETKVTIVYTKDVEEEIMKMIANMNEEKKQSDYTDSTDKLNQVNVHTKLKTPDNMLPGGLEHSEEIPKTLSKDSNAGMNLSIDTTQKKEGSQETLSEETEIVTNRQGSDDFEHVTTVPLEMCLIRYMKSQEEMRMIKSKFSVEINFEICHIVISGNSDIDVSRAAKAIKDLASSVQMSFRLKVDPVREDSEEWRELQTKAKKNNASVYVENISCRSPPDKASFHIGNSEVKLYCGLVTDIAKVGIVVCPVNNSLMPNTPMSEIIFETGGETLYSAATTAASKFVSSNRNRHPPVGWVQFINEVGSLPCSLVACIVVDENFKTIESKLITALSHILVDASEKQLYSVVIPVEVNNSIPVQLSTNACVEALKITAAKQVVSPVVYLGGLIADNMKLAATILQTEDRTSADGSCEMVDVYSNDVGVLSSKVKLEIAVGSLLDQKVDTVVCVVHKSFKLEGGKVGELILKQGGEQIQSELLQQSRRSHVGLADVVDTDGGKLAFKRILFGSLPKMKNDNKDYVMQNIKLFLRNCYLRAKQHGCESIAFPVFGTGGLGYDLEVVAREMFRAVYLYAAANSVTEVRFVLIPQDEAGQKVFAKMNKTYRQLQESIDAREDCCPYYDVKISDLKTKVIVVKTKDYEALAADVIAELVESDNKLQGYPNYLIKTKETEDESCLSDRYMLQFHGSLTLSDFQDCLKFFLWRYTKKHSIVSLDFTKGLNDTGHYTRGAIELLRTQAETVKDIRQITIVSTERSFTEVQSSESGTEMENKTWALSSFLPSFLKQHKVAWYLKHFISTRQREPKYRCLVVVHSRDSDTHKQIILDIDYLFKKAGGSFGDGDKDECTRQSLSPETSTSKSKKYAGSESVDTSLNLKSHTNDIKDRDSAESSTSTAAKGQIETDSEDEFEEEIFGSVQAVFSPEITSKMPSEKLADELQDIGNAEVSFTSFGSKTQLNFKYSERYEVQEMMLKMKTKGLINKKRKETISKTEISGSAQYKVEDVDDNLYDLLLLYIRENHAHTSVKEEHLQREGTTVHVLTEEPIFDVVKTKLRALRGWNTETICFREDKRADATQVVSKLKDEDQNIIVKLIGKEIRIYGPSENTAPAKHKVNIALGVIKTTGRKRRQFNDDFSSLQTEILPEEQGKNISTTKCTSTETPTRQYRTDEGIAVHVYKGDITSLKVDCIVNAANEHLNHVGGVARAISEAAGPAFQNESSRFVTIYGQIPVTRCVETSPGDLRYKYVIHAVGPRFTRDADTSKCLTDLAATVFNALKRADELNMVSVAFPSISAGIFGGQIDDCADAYVRGICRFSRQLTRFILTEIHFVDVQEGFVRKIQSEFDKVFQLTQAPFAVSVRTNNIPETDRNLEDTPFQPSASKHEKDVEQSSKRVEDKGELQGPQHSSTSCSYKPPASMQSERENQTEEAVKSNLYPKLDTNRTHVPLAIVKSMEYTTTPSLEDTSGDANLAAKKLPVSVKENSSTDLIEYISDKGIKIYICKGDISMLSVDAIVCPEHTNCQGVNSIARSIKSVLGNNSVWVEAKQRRPKPLSILRITTQKGAPYKYVILVFSPRWNRELLTRTRNQTLNQQTYWASIRKIILGTLEDSEQTATGSIAFPLIGVGDDTTPHQLCCEVLCEEIASYANDKNRTSLLKEIYIMSKDEGVHFMCKEVLSKRFPVAATDMRLGSKHKNAEPVRSKAKQCSVCHNFVIIGCDTCNKCLENKRKETERYTNHPFCTMRHQRCRRFLPGYANCETIWVVYEIPAGKQRDGDPQPGKQYKTTSFNAYLPANEEGLTVLQLLQKAVEKGLVFKVRKDGTVGWSGLVEHKTSLVDKIHLADKRYGFPDPHYLSKVREQLARHGIWPDIPKTSRGNRE